MKVMENEMISSSHGTPGLDLTYNNNHQAIWLIVAIKHYCLCLLIKTFVLPIVYSIDECWTSDYPDII